MSELDPDKRDILIIELMSEVTRLRDELGSIAGARPEGWYDPSQFRAWAQSRARHALDKISASEATGDRCSVCGFDPCRCKRVYEPYPGAFDASAP